MICGNLLMCTVLLLGQTVSAFNGVRKIQLSPITLKFSSEPTENNVVGEVSEEKPAEVSAASSSSSDDDLDICFDELAMESAAEAAQVKPQVAIPARAAELKAPRQAGWFPLLLAPDYLDGSMAGDVGFDPLGLASRPGMIYWMREAEVKHVRLAMLAAVGWPISELQHNKIAEALGLENLLVDGERAPSILNGGLNNVWAYGALAFAVLAGGALEAIGLRDSENPVTWEDVRRPAGYKPGNYQFDPLGLYTLRSAFQLDRVMEELTPQQKRERAMKDMELAEIKNGRLAMLGVVGMVVQELVFKSAVVEQTPYFFGDQLS
mmetsp:Transcript_31505/g.32055  ORF Transcript_31505/g.32055 Transcript_31505/m.32055 type:complete len:321 (-) Transcript_31505:124-1086(-)|eukprot:CAMPEP_0182427208 /NCGR_PEP_ID=MMETSP1167-20130531/15720_1 /TAXON_ID=2988 /ORGANISM="Mallomonas Sp, Strain CCMP3275" /LENGTH=320 /DNA_ID=CAMNT_0024609267 /DNA_START=115 /DNA_END=1077 /DNA_ORIENTATION=+